MSASLSLSELTALYSSKKKNPALLFAQVPPQLPGSTTLEKIRKLYFTRQNGSLPLRPRSWPVDGSAQQRTIAICLIIVDRLHHEDIWRHWCESSASDEVKYKARLFVHAKHPERITSSWLRERLLPYTFAPEWNSVEVVQAMLSVLEEALVYREHNPPDALISSADYGDGECGRFVFGTESCLPIYSLQETGRRLFSRDVSWLDASHDPKSSWENATCFRAVDDRVVPPAAVWKALPGWIMLNRKHAAELISLMKYFGGWGTPIPAGNSYGCFGDKARTDNRLRSTGAAEDTNQFADDRGEIIPAWGPGGAYDATRGGVFAPEEVFFATMLSILGYLRERAPSDNSNEIEIRRVTYADWAKHSDANPICFTTLDRSILNLMRSTGSVFGRKFTANSIHVSAWTELVLDGDTSEKSKESGDDRLDLIPSNRSMGQASSISDPAQTVQYHDHGYRSRGGGRSFGHRDDSSGHRNSQQRWRDKRDNSHNYSEQFFSRDSHKQSKRRRLDMGDIGSHYYY